MDAAAQKGCSLEANQSKLDFSHVCVCVCASSFPTYHVCLIACFHSKPNFVLGWAAAAVAAVAVAVVIMAAAAAASVVMFSILVPCRRVVNANYSVMPALCCFAV